MTILTEGRHPVAFILSEGPGQISRDAITIGLSQVFDPGTVLGKRAIVGDVAAAGAVGASNAGNATLALASPPITAKAVNGRYKGIAASATTVRWEDPNGKEIGTSTHGAAFNKGGVKLTVTAGATASVAGDEFYVDVFVEANDEEYVALDLTADDGSETAVAVACYGSRTTESQRTKIAGFVRLGEVNGHELVLPDDATPNQVAKIYNDLKAQHIIVRN